MTYHSFIVEQEDLWSENILCLVHVNMWRGRGTAVCHVSVYCNPNESECQAFIHISPSVSTSLDFRSGLIYCFVYENAELCIAATTFFLVSFRSSLWFRLMSYVYRVCNSNVHVLNIRRGPSLSYIRTATWGGHGWGRQSMVMYVQFHYDLFFLS